MALREDEPTLLRVLVVALDSLSWAAAACPRAGGAVRARWPDCQVPLVPLDWPIPLLLVGQLGAICPFSPHL
jgi:hypothetical protein